MAERAIRGDESLGLVVALALHAGLIALLVWNPGSRPPPLPARITVTISDQIAKTDTSPDPRAEAAPDLAPTLGAPAPEPAAPVAAQRPAPPVAEPRPAPPPPVPKPVHRQAPEPRPVAPTPPPRPIAKPLARTPPRPEPKPRPAPSPPAPPKAEPARARTRPAPDPIAQILAGQPKSAAHVASAARAPTTSAPKQVGGSRIGNDFLQGVAGAHASGKATSPPAKDVGPEVKAGLSSAISRQIKPHWVAPQGADADQLVTILAWDLNPDGSLDGSPRVVRQEGITDSNRPQASRHAEQAVRAVELAAPFQLPPEYYSTWKRPVFRFDRKLSQ